MENAALVELALVAQACSNKELALRLGVSPSQISNWKRKDGGGHMSAEMTTKLRELAGVGEGRSAEFVLACGGIRNAEKWEAVMSTLAIAASEAAETGYDTVVLTSPKPDLYEDTFRVLEEMGVSIPEKFPSELEAEAQSEDCEEDDFHGHPLGELISRIYHSYNDVFGFYAAYIADFEDDPRLFSEETSFVYSNLLRLAAAKIEPPPEVVTKFGRFQVRVLEEYSEVLSDLKARVASFGVPLRAELMDMVQMDHVALGAEAERESFGFNQSRDHPDIYTNEILQGMREIQRVLPAILRKLEITEEDIRLGESVELED